MNTNNWAPPKFSLTSPSSSPPTPASSLAPLPPAPPAPPKFPTVEELIEEQVRLSSTPRTPRGGLFHELMQSRPEPMYLDSLEHPDKYPEELRTLLSELVNSRRQPSSEERAKLDAAVLDFSSSPRQPAPPPKKQQPQTPSRMMDFRTPDFASQGEDPSPGPEPALGVGGNPRPFWWL